MYDNEDIILLILKFWIARCHFYDLQLRILDHFFL